MSNTTPTDDIHDPNNKIYARYKKACKFCNSQSIVKNGKKDGIQQYLCKDCGHQFFLNGRLPNVQNDKRIIAMALELYFEGLSLRKTARMIKKIYGVEICNATIYNWIKNYAPLVKEFTKAFKPNCAGGIWHNDETMIKSKGDYIYYWDIIDEDTKFLLDGFSSGRRRSYKEARNLYKNARDYCGGLPSHIYCDGYRGYEKGIASSFNRNLIKFHSKTAISSKKNNNAIERFHGTMKDRLKTMRGLQNPEALLDAYIIHYNFLRPHQSLKGQTPAQASGINLALTDGWGEMIDWATKYKHREDERKV